jgi:hypothetical protein
MSSPGQAEPTVIEWGSDSPPRWSWWRHADPRNARGLAGLAALATFGSLVGNWQVASWDPENEGALSEAFADLASQYPAGFSTLGTWASGWLVGLFALAACTGLAVFAEAPVNRYARTAGLTVAAVQAGLFAVIALDLLRSPPLSPFESIVILGSEVPEPQLSWGPGLYAAGAGLLLVAAAIWRSRPVPALESQPQPAGPQPPEAASVPPQSGSARSGPADLAVGPAERFTAPTDDQQWRRGQ